MKPTVPIVPSPVKQLKLPTTYRTITRIEGHVLLVRYELRALLSPPRAMKPHSGTNGHEIVYAEREGHGPWKEVTARQFANRAMSVIVTTPDR